MKYYFLVYPRDGGGGKKIRPIILLGISTFFSISSTTPVFLSISSSFFLFKYHYQYHLKENLSSLKMAWEKKENDWTLGLKFKLMKHCLYF